MALGRCKINLCPKREGSQLYLAGFFSPLNIILPELCARFKFWPIVYLSVTPCYSNLNPNSSIKASCDLCVMSHISSLDVLFQSFAFCFLKLFFSLATPQSSLVSPYFHSLPILHSSWADLKCLHCAVLIQGRSGLHYLMV